MVLDFFRVTPKSRKIRLKRRKSGVLFSNPGGLKRIIFYLGSWLFLSALFFLLYLYFPIGKAYFNYWQTTKTVAAGISETAPTPTLIPTPDRKEIEPGYNIFIPKILAKAKVIDNVSPFDQKEYLKVLENNSVAQAKETADPGSGKGKTIYIFAHSSGTGLSLIRNNPVFYLLGELKSGDEIIVTKDNREFIYRVYNQMVIEASRIEYLKYTDPDKEVLILQTCWPVGTDWKRLLIFAELTEN